MVTLVVVINVAISLICLYVARRIVKLRSRLVKITDKILAAERKTYKVLHNTPTKIYKGQRVASRLQKQYQQLEYRLQRLERVLTLLNLGLKVWRGRSPQRKQRLRTRSGM